MTWLCRVLVIMTLVTPCLSYGFPTTGILDDFNRSNQDPIAGIWTQYPLGGSVGCRVSSNTAIKQAGTPGDGCYVTATFSQQDQEAYATFPNATSHVEAGAARLHICLEDVGTTGADGYNIKFAKDASTDILTLERLSNGSNTQLGAVINQEVDDDDKLGIERKSDGTLHLWYDSGSGWTDLGNRSDSTYDCTDSNIGIGTTSTSFAFDDYGGGNTVIPSTANYGPIIFK